MFQTDCKYHKMEKTQVYDRFSYFTKDEMPIVDELQFGHPLTLQKLTKNVEKISVIVFQDRKRTIEVLQNYLAQFLAKWLFHHDNAPGHTALTFRQFLDKNVMNLVTCTH